MGTPGASPGCKAAPDVHWDSIVRSPPHEGLLWTTVLIYRGKI